MGSKPSSPTVTRGVPSLRYQKARGMLDHPQPVPKPPRPDGCGLRVVYFIRAGTSGPIKIGVAQDPEARLKAMQTGSAERLRIIGLLITEDAYEFEQELHNIWRTLRIRGEWFEPHPDLLEFISTDARDTVGDYDLMLRKIVMEAMRRR